MYAARHDLIAKIIVDLLDGNDSPHRAALFERRESSPIG
jgi:hypothetical protein